MLEAVMWDAVVVLVDLVPTQMLVEELVAVVVQEDIQEMAVTEA
jgi:hypothetical protein